MGQSARLTHTVLCTGPSTNTKFERFLAVGCRKREPDVSVIGSFPSPCSHVSSSDQIIRRYGLHVSAPPIRTLTRPARKRWLDAVRHQISQRRCGTWHQRRSWPCTLGHPAELSISCQDESRFGGPSIHVKRLRCTVPLVHPYNRAGRWGLLYPGCIYIRLMDVES